MNNNFDRAKLREMSLTMSNDLADEIGEIDDANSLPKKDGIIWTIDTSSFLTLICC